MKMHMKLNLFMKLKKKWLIIGVLLGLICTGLGGAAFMETKPPELIRLHVIANSNSEQDQLLKYKVRDSVIRTMGEAFGGAENIEQSRRILLSQMHLAEQAARAILDEAGCQDELVAFYGEYDFPTKYYGAFTLPAGRYEALRLVIGDGQGANWWCVLFPPLCFVSAEQSKTDAKCAEQKEIKIKPVFKIVELLKRPLFNG